MRPSLSLGFVHPTTLGVDTWWWEPVADELAWWHRWGSSEPSEERCRAALALARGCFVPACSGSQRTASERERLAAVPVSLRAFPMSSP